MTTISVLALLTILIGLAGILVAAGALLTGRHRRYRALRTEHETQKQRVAGFPTVPEGTRGKLTGQKVVRDFLYVDGERLYSLYSQVFEGVAEEIVQSYISGLGSREGPQKDPLAGGAIEAQVAELSGRTESRVLYDHMYNELEAALSSALVRGEGITQDNYQRKLSKRLMIKVTGRAEVEDFERISLFVDHFNQIGEAIAYSGLLSSGIADAVKDLEKRQKTGDRNEQARARHRAKQLDAKKLAEEMGLQQDETAMQNIKMMTELFNRGSYEVMLDPGSGITFRGVLNRKWLRMPEGLLRSLYGVSPATAWTMVGQVTHVPQLRTPPGLVTEDEHLVKDIENEELSPSMRDPLRKLFRSSGAFERMFLESQEGTEVVVAPLAVYREFAVGGDEEE